MPCPITTSVIAIQRALSQSGTRVSSSGSSDAASSASTHSTAPASGCRGAPACGAAVAGGVRQNGRMGVLRAVVTGASSGIGEATVRAFRAAGWEVVGVARREDRLRALADETGASVFVADLTDQRDVDALRDHLGPPARCTRS